MTWQSSLREEPQVGDFVQILGPDGEPSMTNTRVKSVLSFDRTEDLYEIVDSFNQVRIVTNLKPREWLEVLIDN